MPVSDVMGKKIVFLALPKFEHYYDAIIEELDCPYEVCFDWSLEAVLAARPIVVASVHSIPPQLGILIPELNERGIRTVGIQDGVIEWRHTFVNAKSNGSLKRYRPVWYEYMIVFGPLWKRIIEMWGNEGKSVVLGSPRWDSLTEYQRQHEAYLSTKPDPKKFRILVASARTPYFDEDQKNVVTGSYRDVLDCLKTRNDVEIIWRVADDLEKELGLTRADDRQPKLSKQLAESDLVICTPSTLVLEAMIVGCPVLQLNYFHYPRLFSCAWEATHAGQLPELVESALSRPPEIMAFQQALLSDMVQNIGHSAPAVAQFIQDLHHS